MNIFQKISLGWKLMKAAKAAREAKMKSGVFTSEFWLAILSQAVPILLSLWGFIPANIMVQVMAISGVLAGIYALSRSIVKATASKEDDIKFNKFMAVLKPLLEKLGIKVEDLPVA